VGTTKKMIFPYGKRKIKAKKPVKGYKIYCEKTEIKKRYNWQWEVEKNGVQIRAEY
jgi:hypothetical protein